MKRRAERGAVERRVLLGVVGLALGGAAIWRGARQQHASPSAASETSTRQEAQTRRDVAPVLQKGDDESIRQLVARYISGAGARDTLDTRQQILDALYELESLPLRLHAVLGAIAGDPTPPEDDPLWSRAIDKMSRTCQDDLSRLPQAQELMLMESRLRARRFMATALAQFAQSEPAQRLSADHRIALSQDLIDEYFSEEAIAFRPELVPAIHSLSGGDVSLLLTDGAQGVKLDEMGVMVRREQAIKQMVHDLGTQQQ